MPGPEARPPNVGSPAPLRGSGLRELLGRRRLELEPDERLVADDPRVVAGLDDVRLTGTDFLLRAVLVGDGHRTGLGEAHMPELAAVGSDDRLDAVRPRPSRLESQA